MGRVAQRNSILPQRKGEVFSYHYLSLVFSGVLNGPHSFGGLTHQEIVGKRFALGYLSLSIVCPQYKALPWVHGTEQGWSFLHRDGNF